MPLLDRLERKLGRFAVPNVILFLVLLQSLSFILWMAVMSRAGNDPTFVNPLTRLILVPRLVLQGEVWRLVTFVLMPPTTNPLFAFFALVFLYTMGQGLEGYWGSFRLNLYLLIGWLATVAASFVTPDMPVLNLFFESSIFLAFAFLYPEYQILMFFVLPVKVKWIAYLTWGFYAYVVLFAPWSQKLQVLAALLNFLLFFGHTLYLRLKYGSRKATAKAKKLTGADNKPFHTCATCGRTDKTHPKLEFRYCPDCAGTPGYCIDHINNHEHIKAPAQ